MSDISILIVEDEPEFRRVYAETIAHAQGFALAGAAATGKEGIALFDRILPDVLLVDLGLPDMSGIDVIRHAAARRGDCDILVVTIFGDDGHVVASIEAGATGYVLKDNVPSGLIECIRLLRDGGSPISPSIARRLLSRMRMSPARAHPKPGVAVKENPLSERELEILRQVAKGMSFQEIGGVLGISAHTVVAHVKNIYRKLAVHSRGEAVFEATQMGLI